MTNVRAVKIHTWVDKWEQRGSSSFSSYSVLDFHFPPWIVVWGAYSPSESWHHFLFFGRTPRILHFVVFVSFNREIQNIKKPPLGSWFLNGTDCGHLTFVNTLPQPSIKSVIIILFSPLAPRVQWARIIILQLIRCRSRTIWPSSRGECFWSWFKWQMFQQCGNTCPNGTTPGSSSTF